MSAQRFIVAFDSHGDQQDDAAVEEFFDFKKSYKPDIVWHGGDAFDFRAIRKGASEEDRNESMKADVERGIEFMQRLDPSVWLWGNHDQRIDDTIKGHQSGNTRLLASSLKDKILDSLPNTKIIPYNKRTGYATLGDVRVMHGYKSGAYAARQMAQAYGNVLFGHIHAASMMPCATLDGAVGYSSGSLCKLDMDYNRSHVGTLQQRNGWAYGEVRGGRTIVSLYTLPLPEHTSDAIIR